MPHVPDVERVRPRQLVFETELYVLRHSPLLNESHHGPFLGVVHWTDIGMLRVFVRDPDRALISAATPKATIFDLPSLISRLRQ